MKKKYNFFIFDLDGVIFDSKKNMFLSWEATKHKFRLSYCWKWKRIFIIKQINN